MQHEENDQYVFTGTYCIWVNIEFINGTVVL